MGYFYSAGLGAGIFFGLVLGVLISLTLNREKRSENG